MDMTKPLQNIRTVGGKVHTKLKAFGHNPVMIQSRVSKP